MEFPGEAKKAALFDEPGAAGGGVCAAQGGMKCRNRPKLFQP